jgi:sugar lactone lactonase YvrE
MVLVEEYAAELVVDSQCILGEGPIWNESANRLYWLDIHGKKVHSYDILAGNHEFQSFPIKLSALVFKEDGRAVAAGENGFYQVDLEHASVQPIADPEQPFVNTLFNDGKCDPKGRFFAGTIAKNRGGALYRLDPGGKVSKLLSEVGCSNGIAWSLDLKTMYYIDTSARSLDAFDYELESGHIHNRRTIIRYTDKDKENNDILPDGMTWDREGRLWIAEWGGWKVSCWNPNTGERLAVVHVPAQFVTSCVFAGENLDELYITSALHNLTPEQLREQPHAGGLFRVRTGAKGFSAYACKGE